jgi:hypothetical protein
VSYSNFLDLISNEAIRYLIRGTVSLEADIVFEDVPASILIELQNFKNTLRAELQHRGDFAD